MNEFEGDRTSLESILEISLLWTPFLESKKRSNSFLDLLVLLRQHRFDLKHFFSGQHR